MTLITDANVLELPRRQRGRQGVYAETQYQLKLAGFCARILQIQSSLDFQVSARGWAYVLERHGLRKGDFDDCERLINVCRKSGALPLDICGDDLSRQTVCLERTDTPSVRAQAQSWIDFLRNRAHQNYTPISFWENPKFYCEMVVEKIDILNLFAPVCQQFHVALTNLKGWSDLNKRAAIMRRLAHWEARGKKIVLLVFTDHDPGGLHIAEKLRKNLEDLSQAVGWSPRNLVVIRFGLDADFINQHGLTWIDNLETSSGQQLDDPDHNDHDKRYVQEYIRKFGVRKCEANALVVEPALGRDLCRRTIEQFISKTAADEYERELESARARLHREILKQLKKGLR